jgi:TPR repeat protein
MMKICIIILITLILTGFAFAENAYSAEQLLAIKATEDQIAQQEKEQFDAWKIKAEKGDLAATFMVGIAYLYGQGTDVNLSEGDNLVRDAADKGYPEAQNWLGDFYADFGTKEGYAKALEWWNKAAAQGEAHAQFSLGQSYEHGAIITQDYKTAVSYYRASAEQGITDAMFALSTCYLEGKGVKKDVKEAYFWMLVNFPDSWDEGYASIESIAEQLKPADIKKVRARAQKWLDKDS